jgi:hypothetical protein
MRFVRRLSAVEEVILSLHSEFSLARRLPLA